MSHLFHFLTDLALDINKQNMLEADSTALVDAAGLSEADKAALRRGDRAGLITALADELPIDELAAVMGSCWVYDPGPDPTPDPDPGPEDGD